MDVMWNELLTQIICIYHQEFVLKVHSCCFQTVYSTHCVSTPISGTYSERSNPLRGKFTIISTYFQQQLKKWAEEEPELALMRSAVGRETGLCYNKPARTESAFVTASKSMKNKQKPIKTSYPGYFAGRQKYLWWFWDLSHKMTTASCCQHHGLELRCSTSSCGLCSPFSHGH